MSANAMVPVQFHGDTLLAVKDEDGKVWVSLRKCCESLGVPTEKQIRKLKSKPWATMALRAMVADDGNVRQMSMIDLDTLPGWLFSIDARKVKEDVREKLARYQKEAARVLADHFFGRRGQSVPVDTTQQLLGLLVQSHQQMTAMFGQVVTALSDQSRLLAVIAERSFPAPAAPRFPTLAEKRAITEKAINDNPGVPDRELARRTGLDSSTISRTRRRLTGATADPQKQRAAQVRNRISDLFPSDN